jgi:uncharacterized protein (TIGR02246 family)
MTLETADIVALQQVYAAYSHAADAGDGEALADLFVPDGVLDFGFGSVSGREGLVGFGANVAAGAPGIKHVVSNVLVDGAGDDATGRATVVTFLPGEPAPVLNNMGRYEDTFVRVDGTWRLRVRKWVGD